MNRFVYLIVIFSLLFMSCNRERYATKPGAHGNAGNIMVVMENNQWNSEPGDSLRAVFHQFCRALPRSEYLFSLHQIPRERFIDQNRYHRNIIFCEISSEVESPSITISRDNFARRQLFVKVSAPGQKEFGEEISKYKDDLIKLFLEEDRDRFLFYIRNHTNATIVNNLRNKHEVHLSVPRNYVFAENRDDFVWMYFQTVHYDMGIFVYHTPLSDTSSLDYEYLISRRNRVLKENVPGDGPGTYMSTETKFYPPYLDIINHNNLTTAYMQGLWRVEGDFMGGPFVGYTKIDRARNRMVTAEGFVYYPNQDMRDMIRRLDAILFTFDIVK